MTITKWLAEMYKDLEESKEFDDLLKGINSVSIYTGKKEFRYDTDGATPLSTIEHFDWGHSESKPKIWFNFVNFKLGKCE